MIYKDQHLDNELVARRVEVRRAYETPAGKAELARRIMRYGLLASLDTQADVVRHNLIVQDLEEMGVLDEEGIPGFVDWLLSQPVCYRKTDEEIEAEKEKKRC